MSRLRERTESGIMSRLRERTESGIMSPKELITHEIIPYFGFKELFRLNKHKMDHYLLPLYTTDHTYNFQIFYQNNMFYIWNDDHWEKNLYCIKQINDHSLEYVIDDVMNDFGIYGIADDIVRSEIEYIFKHFNINSNMKSM
jgi:hypothetical protein